MYLSISSLTPYEQLRENNIQTNLAFLESLGFGKKAEKPVKQKEIIKKRKKNSGNAYDSDENDEDLGHDDEDLGHDDEDLDVDLNDKGNNDSVKDEKVYTLDEFKDLQGKSHYDDEDGFVYMSAEIVEKEFKGLGIQIVVHRKKYLEDLRKYGRIDRTDPILALDVKALHENQKNIDIMNEILNRKK